MTREDLLENLLIYHNSLSVYYLVCVFITILSVVLAWWYNKVNDFNIVKCHQHPEEKCSRNDQTLEPEEQSGDTNGDFIGKIKIGQQSLLVEQVAASMTEDQVREEREVERKQLEAIFQLLRKEEDKFQVSSLEELEDQLKLYRH